jgi:hypothetical protein
MQCWAGGAVLLVAGSVWGCGCVGGVGAEGEDRSDQGRKCRRKKCWAGW